MNSQTAYVPFITDCGTKAKLQFCFDNKIKTGAILKIHFYVVTENYLFLNNEE